MNFEVYVPDDKGMLASDHALFLNPEWLSFVVCRSQMVGCKSNYYIYSLVVHASTTPREARVCTAWRKAREILLDQGLRPLVGLENAARHICFAIPRARACTITCFIQKSKVAGSL